MASEILSTHQMKLAEQAACTGKTQSFTLMQRAGKAVAEEILSRYSKQAVLILCGAGNNGGDGFIIAATLKKKNWPVTVACAIDVFDLQGDAARAADVWSGDVISFDDLELPEDGLIVDAVFGTGLSRPIEGIVHDVLLSLRETDCPIIAVDVPSGVNADTGECQQCTPQAEVTVTFGWKKPAHLLLPAREAAGEIVIADIGIAEELLEDIGPFMMENSRELEWGSTEFDKPVNAHKYHHGHVVVLGGKVMTGAACLASVSALRMGAGLVTVVAPMDTALTYRSYNPSLLVEPIGEMARFKEHLKDPRRNVVLVGCGAGLDAPAVLKKIVFDSVQSSPQKICVIDADALSVFEDDPRSLVKALGGHCILTPHEGEFARIFPELTGSKPERAFAAARKSGAIIVLKGADTVIASPDDQLVINGNGTGWLASAGTGDVLAGMIAGIIARDMMSPFDAVCAAVWMHARASEIAGAGMISSDLPCHIPAVWKELIDGDGDSTEESEPE
jgi:NAD(P)H-hydrate epimerase